MWKIHIHKEPFSGVKLWIAADPKYMDRGFVKGIENGEFVLEKVPDGRLVEPTLNLSPRDFDSFLNAWAELAWEEGWRPKDYIPNESTLRHLEDMRKIVAKKIGVEL